MGLGLPRFHRFGVGDDAPVLQVDDTGGIGVRQFRVVGDHDDQPVLRHFFQKVHDLDGSFGVQGAGGLIRKDDVRVVDQGAGNGHALHLTAGQLVRPLVGLVAETDLFEGRQSALAPLRRWDVGDGQSQFHIGQDGLVRDEVVVLEDEAHRVVAVGVPVLIGIFFGGDAVDDEVAGVVPVETADDIEQRRFSRAARAQDGDELVVPEGQGDVVEGGLREVARHIGFADAFYFQHASTPSILDKSEEFESAFRRKRSRTIKILLEYELR